MSIIERITPVLARMVLVVGIITGLGSIAVTIIVGEPRLLLFTVISGLSAFYGRQVSGQQAQPLETSEAGVRPLAA